MLYILMYKAIVQYINVQHSSLHELVNSQSRSFDSLMWWLKQCMSARVSLVHQLLLQFESRGSHPSSTGNPPLHHNQVDRERWIHAIHILWKLSRYPLPFHLYHYLQCLVEMRLCQCGGFHLPVGWAVWWWPLLWRAMAGCHRSSLSWGRHTLRHEYQHPHHSH